MFPLKSIYRGDTPKMPIMSTTLLRRMVRATPAPNNVILICLRFELTTVYLFDRNQLPGFLVSKRNPSNGLPHNYHNAFAPPSRFKNYLV
jgi:hypothetical protein